MVQQGDPGDAFYLVVKGAFGVYVAASEGDESRVNSLGPGAPFGEMALLTGRPRSARVRAETTAEVLRLAALAYGLLTLAALCASARLACDGAALIPCPSGTKPHDLFISHEDSQH